VKPSSDSLSLPLPLLTILTVGLFVGFFVGLFVGLEVGLEVGARVVGCGVAGILSVIGVGAGVS